MKNLLSDFFGGRRGSKFCSVLSLVVAVAVMASSAHATFPKRNWIRTAAITYGLTDSVAGYFIGRKYDLVINPSNIAYGSRSGVLDAIKRGDPATQCLVYATVSSYRSVADLADLNEFCAARGYGIDSFFIKVNTGTVGIKDVQPIDAPCSPNGVDTTTAGGFLEFCGWTTSGRREWDFTKKHVRDFMVWRAVKYATNGMNGIMEDENYTLLHDNQTDAPGNAMAFPHTSSQWAVGSWTQCGPWAGKTHAQVRDSLIKLKQNDWLKRIGDTLNKLGGFWIANSVTYGTIKSDKGSDLKKTGTGLFPMENNLAPIAFGNLWSNETWKIMDSINVWDTGYAIVWNTINRADSAALGVPRAQMERLTWYYMAAHPDRTYFMLTGNAPEHSANDYRAYDTLFKWVPATDFNIGLPLANRFTVGSGTDPAGQTYTIYRRDFGNGSVLYRQANGTNYSGTSAVSYSLGGTFYNVNANGTVSSTPITSASIKNCDGLILSRNPGTVPSDVTAPSAVASLAAPNKTTTTIGLTWIAPGDDGSSGTATQYDLRRSTSVITAANYATATIVTGLPSPKASGGSESFTVTGLTANTTYYFALKTADEALNWSTISNVVSAATTASTDGTAPAAISNLLTGTKTANSVALSWTAPGDDGSTGTAAQYDVRYSTSTITASNFGTAASATGEPAPKAAGGAETFTVAGLNASTTYFFAVKTADEAPNWSAISNVVNGATTASADVTAPAAIANLAAGTKTTSSIVLSWTSPGDDGSTGTAAQYDLRYSTALITSANFSTATVVTGEPTPKAAGGAETFTVTGLTQNTTYYFAIKAADEVPNWAVISNVLSAVTNLDPTADSIPPGTVNDLGALPGAEQGQVVLGWTAPGDDGQTGTIHHYEIRRSTAPINFGNWTLATVVGNPPPPVTAGSSQAKTISNLTPGGMYYFAIKAYDEVGNNSLSESSAGFAAGILSPSPVLTEVDSLAGSVTVTVSTVPSYLTLSYEFALDTVANFALPELQTVSNLGLSNHASVDFLNLTSNLEYYWRCRAVSTSPSMSSSWSPAVRFDMSMVVLRALVDSELVTPSPYQVFLTSQPTLEVADVSGVTEVYFQVDNNESFSSPISSGAVAASPGFATSWQVTTPLTDGDWFARASSDNAIWTAPVPFLVSGQAASAIEGTRAYPNPFRPASGNLTFADLPVGSDLVIFTIGGEIVTRMDAIPSTEVTWDGRNLSGHEVASGIYLWQVDPGDKKGKIIVIR
jgi:chitodextrinase